MKWVVCKVGDGVNLIYIYNLDMTFLNCFIFSYQVLTFAKVYYRIVSFYILLICSSIYLTMDAMCKAHQLECHVPTNLSGFTLLHFFGSIFNSLQHYQTTNCFPVSTKCLHDRLHHNFLVVLSVFVSNFWVISLGPATLN